MSINIINEIKIQPKSQIENQTITLYNTAKIRLSEKGSFSNVY